MSLIQKMKWSVLLLTHPLHAENTLPFKSDVANTIHWFPYLLMLGILSATLLFLAKKSKSLIKTNSKCQIIEKITVHYKTKVYVIDYQGQRFLIADNQSALAIQPLGIST